MIKNNITSIKHRPIVRDTTPSDMDEVMGIYDYARTCMRERGNPNQWIDGYPSREVISMDIAQGNSHVIVSEDKILGVFAFIIGDEPSYNVIQGKWLNDNVYGTIHRIASAPGAKGIADICLDFCKSKNIDIRIDTHAENRPMLGWIAKRGFSYCGIIHVGNGTPRKAFQLAYNNFSFKY